MIFFDAHLHLYPAYDRDRFFDAFATHAARLAPGAATWAGALMLREGQGTLGRLLDATTRPGRHWQCVRAPAPGISVMSDGEREVVLFAARQVATRERIELLGLFSEADVPDGLSLAETGRRLRGAGALPVLAWGLGKWLFGRGLAVKALIDATENPDDLLIGDSALRPSFCGLPRLMRRAQNKGLRLIYGSDPLPRPDEESVAGQYASLIAGDLGCGDPAAALRRRLLDRSVTVQPVGQRHDLCDTLIRIR
jgi:hypothetical protein